MTIAGTRRLLILASGHIKCSVPGMATIAEPGIAEVGETWEPKPAPSSRPSPRTRVLIAVAIGVASALFAAFAFTRPDAEPDFLAWYRGAQILLSGANPYTAPLGSDAWPFHDPLYYPLPTLLLVAPLTRLSPPVAGALLMGISGGILAWLLSRDGLWRLWIFGTPSYFMACKVGQWSPLIVVAALVPTAGFLAAMKPNLGLAALLYRPSWRAAIGCGVAGLVSFAVLPSWLADWHTNTASLIGHPPPVLTPFGPVLLLALLRWRRPEARLLVAMACVPQLLFFADQLPLFLVPSTRREMRALFLCSASAFFVWYLRFATIPQYVLAAAPFALWGTYLPCLVMILRRPNEGEMPAWIDGGAARIRALAQSIR